MSTSYYGGTSHFQTRFPFYANIGGSPTNNTHMPVIKKVIKSCCSLCEEPAELKYRYDICEPCHQDIVNGRATDSEAAPTSDDESSEEDEEPDQKEGESSVTLEDATGVLDAVKDMEDGLTKKVTFLKRS